MADEKSSVTLFDGTHVFKVERTDIMAHGFVVSVAPANASGIPMAEFERVKWEKGMGSQTERLKLYALLIRLMLP